MSGPLALAIIPDQNHVHRFAISAGRCCDCCDMWWQGPMAPCMPYMAVHTTVTHQISKLLDLSRHIHAYIQAGPTLCVLLQQVWLSVPRHAPESQQSVAHLILIQGWKFFCDSDPASVMGSGMPLQHTVTVAAAAQMGRVPRICDQEACRLKRCIAQTSSRDPCTIHSHDY